LIYQTLNNQYHNILYLNILGRNTGLDKSYSIIDQGFDKSNPYPERFVWKTTGSIEIKKNINQLEFSSNWA
jgi:hypothetical protein